MFSSGLFMVHDAAGCGHDDVPELTRGQQVVGPLLDVGDSNVKPGRDDATLVESAGEIDDDFAATVVVDDFELADVAVLHHHSQEMGDHLRRGAKENLSLSTLLSIVD